MLLASQNRDPPRHDEIFETSTAHRTAVESDTEALDALQGQAAAGTLAANNFKDIRINYTLADGECEREAGAPSQLCMQKLEAELTWLRSKEADQRRSKDFERKVAMMRAKIAAKRMSHAAVAALNSPSL